ncbi:hypothetical protein CAC42_6333 [Sphaceloma murrayae]|uniref:Chromo domain-containing protein n=1 Tax=Sphaceloma murrayae TaxID=2082308 RepID=A0A2K1QM42_9PEZI|nr:hypothetical protein CAC42_6333 [Sphaceloma murrayae]
MPPLVSDSDGVSDDLDTIPAKPAKAGAKGKAKPAEPEEEEDADMNGADSGANEEEGSEDEDGETYAVEKILGHDFSEKGVVLYQVKWLGYEQESDLTWEPASSFVGAKDILDQYHKKNGGVPKPDTKKGKGPGRGKRKAEASDSPAPVTKRGRKSDTNGAAWKPPPGSWEKEVNTIETISENTFKDTKGKKSEALNVFLVFNDEHKAAYSMETVRQKCPQKLLDYFVAHLIFKDPEDQAQEVDQPGAPGDDDSS